VAIPSPLEKLSRKLNINQMAPKYNGWRLSAAELLATMLDESYIVC
jgi:hypothetical protein